jgi:hypothetical protein
VKAEQRGQQRRHGQEQRHGIGASQDRRLEQGVVLVQTPAVDRDRLAVHARHGEGLALAVPQQSGAGRDQSASRGQERERHHA